MVVLSSQETEMFGLRSQTRKAIEVVKLGEDLASLPKWAQDRIKDAERELANGQAEKIVTHIFAVVSKTSQVRKHVPKWLILEPGVHHISVHLLGRQDEHVLETRGTGEIMLRPRAGNVVVLTPSKEKEAAPCPPGSTLPREAARGR